MKLIFCVDKQNGMMLFGKRQSQDRFLRERILDLVGDAKLWMSEYSAKQFEPDAHIMVDDDYMYKAGDEDYCFVENRGYVLDNVSEIILCHWNRQYQADQFFDVDLQANQFEKKSVEAMKGSSHDNITIERYVRG